MNNERNNRIRNAGFLATAGLAIAMLGGACTSEVRPSNNPGATATELATATPDTSAAAGSASPEGLVMPSAAPEATSKQEIVSVKDGSVAVNTIIKLPANTVITGDPFFFGGQPGSGQQLEDYQKIEFQVEQIKTQSLVNGQTLTDSRPESGSVWVLKQAMDIQSAPSYGFSWNTLQNADMAEKFALGQQFVTEFLGCGVNDQGQKGCQRVDVIHVPGEMQGPDGPTPVDGTNPSQSPMPSQEPNSSLMPTASEIPTASQMPLGNVDLGSMTKDQEILFLENLINSGKVDMNSETGKTLANLLYCLECTNLSCTVPQENAIPSLAPSQTPEKTQTPATPKPTVRPTPKPTARPTSRPTAKPTPRPTHKPTPEPTHTPKSEIDEPTVKMGQSVDVPKGWGAIVMSDPIILDNGVVIVNPDSLPNTEELNVLPAKTGHKYTIVAKFGDVSWQAFPTNNITVEKSYYKGNYNRIVNTDHKTIDSNSINNLPK